MLNNHTTTETTPYGPRLVAQSKQKTAARAREYHTQVMPSLRKNIEDSWQAGRAVKLIAEEYGVTQANALDIAMRAMERRVTQRMRIIEDSVQIMWRLRTVA